MDPRLTSQSLDRANSEFYLPCLHGSHRRRQDLPPDQSHCSSRVYASYEGQLDHLTSGPGICSEIPAGAHLGAILQHHFLCHWNLDQFADQEEETSSFEEKGMYIRRLRLPKLIEI